MAEEIATAEEVEAAKGNGNGNGHAPDPDDGEGENEIVQLSIEGDGDLTMVVGGNKADQATLSFGGGEIKMGKGMFKKGQRVAILLVGPVTEIHNIDLVDSKTKSIASTKRKHVMKPDDVRRVAMPDGSN